MSAKMFEPRRVLIRNFQSPGDILMLTSAVRDLHLAYPGDFITDVRTPFPELWQNSPYITPLNDRGADVRAIDAHYDIIHNSNEGAYHFVHGFSLHLGRELGVYIPVTKLGGDLHFTESELRDGNLVEREFTGDKRGFWLICTGGKKDYTAKWWIPEYAQAVVNHFRDRIQFVQFGGVGPNHYHPPLEGVIDIVGHTNLRQLLNLVHWADGIVCPVSFAMHAAAAVPTRPEKPRMRACVVTAGGREPSAFTFYTNHQYLHANGAMPCCGSGGCWKSRTAPLGDGDAKDGELCVEAVAYNGRQVQRCMRDLVRPEDVIRGIEKYYEGGALRYLTTDQRTMECSWRKRGERRTLQSGASCAE